MLTVLDALKKSTEYLNSKGVESPRLNAELMLAHILHCRRLNLYLSFERPLNDDELELYRSFLRRRVSFEPLQYILGSVEFYGMDFKVNSSVLIPRPETELLVENIINNFKNRDDLSVLDIGTGSGNIAISLAKHLKSATVAAIDVSETALSLAMENSELNGTSDSIEFLKLDIKNDKLPSDKKFDLIVSNPPYIGVDEYEKLPAELKVYEPRIALTDNADGYEIHNVIIRRSKELLVKGGCLYLELGAGQADNVEILMQNAGFTGITIIKDYQDIKRIIYGMIR